MKILIIKGQRQRKIRVIARVLRFRLKKLSPVYDIDKLIIKALDGAIIKKAFTKI